GPAVTEHLAVTDHIEIVGNAGGFRQVVGHHYAGQPQRIVEQTDQAHQHTHGNRVLDRKSTRLHSSHVKISYAVFCSRKKISHRRTATVTAEALPHPSPLPLPTRRSSDLGLP